MRKIKFYFMSLALLCFVTVSVSAQSAQSKKVNSDRVQKKIETLKKIEDISINQKAPVTKTEQVDVQLKSKTQNSNAGDPNKVYKQRENANKEIKTIQIKGQKTTTTSNKPVTRTRNFQLSQQQKAEIAKKRADRLAKRKKALNGNKIDAKSKIKKLNK